MNILGLFPLFNVHNEGEIKVISQIAIDMKRKEKLESLHIVFRSRNKITKIKLILVRIYNNTKIILTKSLLKYPQAGPLLPWGKSTNGSSLLFLSHFSPAPCERPYTPVYRIPACRSKAHLPNPPPSAACHACTHGCLPATPWAYGYHTCSTQSSEAHVGLRQRF